MKAWIKTHGRLLSLALVALVLATVWLGLRRIGKEPSHRGKTVTEWIQEFERTPKPVARTAPPPILPAVIAYFKTNPPRNSNFANSFTINYATNYHADGSTSYNRVTVSGVTSTIITTNGPPVRQIVHRPPPGGFGTNWVSATGSISNNVPLSALGLPLVGPVQVRPMPAVFTPAYTWTKDPAVLALQNIGAPAVPYLTEALRREEGSIDRLQEWLWKRSPASIQTNYLRQPFPVVQRRRNAAKLLGRMGPDSAPAVPILVRALGDGDQQLRLNAAEALGNLGVVANAAAPALLQLLTESTAPPSLISAADEALKYIGVEPATVERTLEQLQRKSNASDSFARLLKHLDPKNADTARVLLRFLPDSVGQSRQDILIHLVQTGPRAAPGIPMLTGLLKAPTLETRYQAIRVLTAIGPAARAALPELERLYRDDPSLLITTSAARALVTIEGEKPSSPRKR